MRAEDLRVTRGGRVILQDISAEAPQGALTMVLGANGSGKTTLLRALAGLQPLDGGRAMLAGASIHDRSPRERARLIGYVPQRFRSEVPFSVGQVIAMATSDRARRHEAVEALELNALVHRPFERLSVGQQQRVVLARALAQVVDPAVLILDEPLAALDFRHAARVLDLLKGRAAAGSVVLLSVHDLGIASAHADQAWLLSAGTLAASGDPHEVLADERLQQVFGLAFQRLEDSTGRTWLVPRDGPEGID